MEKRTGNGRQKIELKLIESEKARVVTFSKRKKGLFKKADDFSTLTRADVGVLLFSPSGRSSSYGSKSVKEITDKFLELKQDDRQGDDPNVDESNVFETFEDICKEKQALDEKEKEHPRSDILSDKERLEEYMALQSRLDKVYKNIKGKCIRELEEEESS